MASPTRAASAEIARNAATVAGATLVSRVLGFVRDMVVAFALGAGPWADAFFVAFRLPNLMRRLFGEGSLTMAFVPVFTQTMREQGTEEAFVLARAAQFWLTIALGAVIVLALLLAEPLTAAIAPGFVKDRELFAYSVRLVRICFGYSLLICSVALCMGVLNSMGRFLAPALSPSVLNVVLIAAGIGAWKLGLDVGVVLSWSVLAAGLLQWLTQMPPMRAVGFTWSGRWSPGHVGVRRVGRLLAPTVFGAAAYQVNILLSTLLASFLASGSISYLYYADRLVQFPLGVFGVAVSTAALPNLSALASSGRDDEFKEALNSALRLTLFIALPAAVGLIALAEPVVFLLFQRGAFTPQAARATALALAAYGMGLPAFAAVRPLLSACYARQDTHGPVVASVLTLAGFATLGPLLMWPLEHVGLALAVSLASWLNVWYLERRLRRHLGKWRDFLGRSVPFVLLSLGVGLGAWGVWQFCPVRPKLVSLLLIPAWAWLYVRAARLLDLEEAHLFHEAVLGRLLRRLSGPGTGS